MVTTRELTVRIRFTRHCLGNVKSRERGGRFLLPRNPQGFVTFMASWHRANMRFAAQLLGRHQDEVEKIRWDIAVDGAVLRDCWYRRYYPAKTNSGTRQQRYVTHETFTPGQVVGIHCAVPSAISEEDLWQLMRLAGQYCGLSPCKPGEFGFFEVDAIVPRRPPQAPDALAVDVLDVVESRK